jgi:threonine dehydratase
MPLFSLDELKDAAAAIRPIVPPTPAYAWPLLAKRVGATVVVKHENHTPVGAFKVRGGLVYVDALFRAERNLKGLVTATRGNHGQSIALAAARNKIPVAIVVPEGNSREKNAAMEALGAELITAGKDFDESRVTAAQIQKDRGYHYVPSFHRDLVKGVATYAYELFSSFADLDVVYVPIGMGSGIRGVITVRDLLGLNRSRRCSGGERASLRLVVQSGPSDADQLGEDFRGWHGVSRSTRRRVRDHQARCGAHRHRKRRRNR